MKKFLLFMLFFPSIAHAGSVFSESVVIQGDQVSTYPTSDSFSVIDLSNAREGYIYSYEDILKFSGTIILDVTSAMWGFDYSTSSPVPLFVYSYLGPLQPL